MTQHGALPAMPPAGCELVTFRVADHWFGVDVVHVQEVLMGYVATPVPLAPPDVAGVLNLRGQIVTAIDLRVRLALAGRNPADTPVHVVLRDGAELFSFLADEAGDVVPSVDAIIEPLPLLDATWTSVAPGVVRRDDLLLTLLDPIAVVSDTASAR